MDNKIITIDGKINKEIPVFVSLLVEANTTADEIFKRYFKALNNNYDIKEINREIDVDKFLSNLVCENSSDEIIGGVASINFNNKSAVSTGGVIGELSYEKSEQIQDGKIYKIKNEVFYFGYSGNFGILLEGSFESAFKLRGLIESNISILNGNLYKEVNRNNIHIDRMIICFDGTNTKFENYIITVDFKRNEMYKYKKEFLQQRK